MRGRAHLWRLSRDDAAEARKLFERAIELAPSGEFGMGDLALVHFLESYYRWSPSPEHSLDAMLRVAERAVAVDDHDAWALTILAWSNMFAHRWDEALPPGRRARAAAPRPLPRCRCHPDRRAPRAARRR